MDTALLDALLAPMAPDAPSGCDVLDLPDFDALKAARRGDDATLSQGAWEHEVRSPQWSQARRLAEELLIRQGKHLQVAVWYVEVLGHLEGFQGMAFGLTVVEGLISGFWDSLHPRVEDDDLEERAGRLEWLDAQLAHRARLLPLTSGEPGFAWMHWQEALRLDNLGRRDPSLLEGALAEGKVPMEVVLRAFGASGASHLEGLLGDVGRALEATRKLAGTMAARFGAQGPGLEELEGALSEVARLLRQQWEAMGPSGVRPSGVRPSGVRPSGVRPSGVRPSGVWLTADEPPAPEPPGGLGGGTSGVRASSGQVWGQGPIRSRAEAVARLREVAGYFRHHEPHSPVAHLSERAAAWAEMPLERWLATVIKDPGTLEQLRELLGVEG